MGAPVVSITEPPIAPVAPPWPYVRAPKSKVASRNTTPENLRTACIVIPHPELLKKRHYPERECFPFVPQRPVQDDRFQDHHAGFWRTLPRIQRSDSDSWCQEEWRY